MITPETRPGKLIEDCVAWDIEATLVQFSYAPRSTFDQEAGFDVRGDFVALWKGERGWGTHRGCVRHPKEDAKSYARIFWGHYDQTEANARADFQARQKLLG